MTTATDSELQVELDTPNGPEKLSRETVAEGVEASLTVTVMGSQESPELDVSASGV